MTQHTQGQWSSQRAGGPYRRLNCSHESGTLFAGALARWFKGGGLECFWEPFADAASVMSEALLGSSVSGLQLHPPIWALSSEMSTQGGAAL